MSAVKIPWEDLYIKKEVIKELKRVLKSQVPKSEGVRNQVRDNLLTLYNDFDSTVNSCYDNIDDIKYNNYIKPIFNFIRDRVVRSYQVLQVDYKIPTHILKTIDPQVKDELVSIDDSDSDDFQINIEQENSASVNMTLSAPEFFNLASKIVPADAIEGNVEIHEVNAVAYVKTRLTGKARSIVGESGTLDDIILKLSTVLTVTPNSVYKSVLQNCNFTKVTSTFKSPKVCLTQKLKQAYLSEGVPENVAEKYTTDTTVNALSANATSERVKIIMEAGNFNSVQEAV
nr:unnamed protein product [Callosobruchus chinensis]